MKAVLFLLSFSSILALADGFECYVKEFGDNDEQRTESECEACGFHYEICDENEGKYNYLCLSEPSMEYEDENGLMSFNTVDKCRNFTKNGCANSIYICQDDNCNDKCGNSPVATLPLTSTTTTTTSQTASNIPVTTTTITEVNGGTFPAALLPVFGSLTTLFLILY